MIVEGSADNGSAEACLDLINEHEGLAAGSQSTNSPPHRGVVPTATFADWTGGRTIASWGTNAGAEGIPFQRWRHFKEAFAPELVARAIAESPLRVTNCLDPFGGSGTTAVACQFLAVNPITIEVNPFLADLIEAKLATYDTDRLARDLGVVMQPPLVKSRGSTALFDGAPPSFVEPGHKGRWIFDRAIAERIAEMLEHIDQLADESHRRLFRVLLGGVLVNVSNVVTNGKGRRYRQGASIRRREPGEIDAAFARAAAEAIGDIYRYTTRPCRTYAVHCADSRHSQIEPQVCELAVFSPPYPNSFDYTDVYNVELWALGYLSSRLDNVRLRRATLCSHVQASRSFPHPPAGSATLDDAIVALQQRRDELWDARLPEMVGGYFADLLQVTTQLREWIAPGGTAWIVLGDSQYAGIHIPTGEIMSQLAPQSGWTVSRVEPCRSMRVSPQQGGSHSLREVLLVLSRT